VWGGGGGGHIGTTDGRVIMSVMIREGT